MEENILCTTCPDVENNAKKARPSFPVTQSVTKAVDQRTRIGSEPRTMNLGCKDQVYKVQDKTDRSS
ncbi:hypothetical protein JG688_00014449 [Phytophthora aleatoria]|uniref:Uncharacterized protein n=1 Tax=Phytophthora aleatoria TaxID=2496075 RepID=A0A8J5MDG1_9STRA|nr:hypothetical protein JG688_00014449 [Phytophthora aleatoria]